MVVHSDTQCPLCRLLTDDKIIEVGLDFRRSAQREVQGCGVSPFGRGFFHDNGLRLLDATVANVSGSSGNQDVYFVLSSAAKGA